MADQKGRKLDQRKTDVLAALNKQADLWLATADMTGRPHLIAISAWWDGSKVIVATTGGSRTAMPSRIQAYRGYDELSGRDVMRDGRWLA